MGTIGAHCGQQLLAPVMPLLRFEEQRLVKNKETQVKSLFGIKRQLYPLFWTKFFRFSLIALPSFWLVGW